MAEELVLEQVIGTAAQSTAMNGKSRRLLRK